MTQLYLDPVVRAFVEKTEKKGGTPLYELTPSEARQVLLDVQAEYEPSEDVQLDEYQAPLDDGRKMKFYILKPVHATEPLPTVFYMHGGGWVMGGLQTHRRLVENLVLKANVAVVFPEYELSPESQFPQTFDDLFTVLRYVYDYAANFDLQKEKFALAGDSAGGNMAFALALKAEEQKLNPSLKMLLLLYPVVGDDFSTPSYKEFANGPWLSLQAMKWFWNNYAPDKALRRQPFADLLMADLSALSDLPPSLIITAQNDVLRDEGEMLAQRLSETGHEVVSVRINGVIHDFMMLNALAESKAVKLTEEIVSGAIKEAFA